jgi:hypothetical protein
VSSECCCEDSPRLYCAVIIPIPFVVHEKIRSSTVNIPIPFASLVFRETTVAASQLTRNTDNGPIELPGGCGVAGANDGGWVNRQQGRLRRHHRARSGRQVVLLFASLQRGVRSAEPNLFVVRDSGCGARWERQSLRIQQPQPPSVSSLQNENSTFIAVMSELLVHYWPCLPEQRGIDPF